MYNKDNQYRCTIIRGKAKTELDNLLPLYASIIDKITPCSKESFPEFFNEKVSIYLKNSEKKTLDNHRTEIAGKLFGLYLENKEGLVLETERCRKFLEDNDQPAFFKELCFKMQFPNGMDSVFTIRERVEKKIKCRNLCKLVSLLQFAERKNIYLSIDEVGYYVLNNLDFLRSLSTNNEILEAILSDRKNGIKKTVLDNDKNKASSYHMQHIREQLVYLELANLIRIKNKIIYLNNKENHCISIFVEASKDPLPFDVSKYNIKNSKSMQELVTDWMDYYGRLSKYSKDFSTTLDALSNDEEKSFSSRNNIELGDDGEKFVIAYEKERVGKFDRHLTNRVIWMGKIQGLGYDILSVMANNKEEGQLAKYIEVKTTKRVTTPNFDEHFNDSVNITRNEWIAAKQNGHYFSIYRLYFTPSKIIVAIIENPFDLATKERIALVPLNYRIDFDSNVFSQIISRNI